MHRRIAICIATYHRTEMLGRLLASLREIQRPADCSIEVRVVDNDAAASAAKIPARVWGGAGSGLTLRFAVEPEQNIAAARNRALEMGPVDLVAFIDDDEVAERAWLTELVAAIDRTDADAVFGPVLGGCPGRTPAWIVRGKFFDKPTGPQDGRLHWRETRTSNALVRGRWFWERRFRFDTAYGRSGGEDTNLFVRMAAAGARYAAAPGATVREEVEAERTCFAWLWRRRRLGAIAFHRHCAHDPRASHPALQFGWRMTKALLGLIAGLPFWIVGRPERLYRALLGFALAAGGLEAWLAPGRAASQVGYAARTSVPRAAESVRSLSARPRRSARDAARLHDVQTHA